MTSCFDLIVLVQTEKSMIIAEVAILDPGLLSGFSCGVLTLRFLSEVNLALFSSLSYNSRY